MKLPLQITVRNADVAPDVYDAVHAHQDYARRQRGDVKQHKQGPRSATSSA
jgi:hypothetical protein